MSNPVSSLLFYGCRINTRKHKGKVQDFNYHLGVRNQARKR